MLIREMAIDILKTAAYNPRGALSPGDTEFENIKHSCAPQGKTKTAT